MLTVTLTAYRPPTVFLLWASSTDRPGNTPVRRRLPSVHRTSLAADFSQQFCKIFAKIYKNTELCVHRNSDLVVLLKKQEEKTARSESKSSTYYTHYTLLGTPLTP